MFWSIFFVSPPPRFTVFATLFPLAIFADITTLDYAMFRLRHAVMPIFTPSMRLWRASALSAAMPCFFSPALIFCCFYDIRCSSDYYHLRFFFPPLSLLPPLISPPLTPARSSLMPSFRHFVHHVIYALRLRLFIVITAYAVDNHVSIRYPTIRGLRLRHARSEYACTRNTR